jgi:exosome complex RNA-binding protein Csl4
MGATKSIKLERLNVKVWPSTKEKLLSMADGERKLGWFISQLVDEEYTRQNLSLGGLAKRLESVHADVIEVAEMAFDLQNAMDTVAVLHNCAQCGKSLGYDGGRLTCRHCGTDVDSIVSGMETGRPLPEVPSAGTPVPTQSREEMRSERRALRRANKGR